MMFQPAKKEQLKARIALIGPSGSGKTYSALQLATGLGSKIAVVDTEHRSASLYADRFTFDVLNLDSFEPERYIEAMHAAGAAGYDVVVIDSLSHAWMGKGGALEQVDNAAARNRGNSYAGWREVTPKHNALVDAMIRCECHLIVTMRAKTEYVVEKDDKTGKSAPRKIGMAAVQRDGLEYEFTVVGDMDLDHKMVVSKSRYDKWQDAVFQKPTPELGAELLTWLDDGEPRATEAQRTELKPFVKSLADFKRLAVGALGREVDRFEDLTQDEAAKVIDYAKAQPANEPDDLNDDDIPL